MRLRISPVLAVALAATTTLVVSVTGVPEVSGAALDHRAAAGRMLVVHERVLAGGSTSSGDMSPGHPETTELKIVNTGVLASRTLSLGSPGCTQRHAGRGAPDKLCSWLRLSVSERDRAGRFVPTGIRNRPLAGLADRPVVIGNGIPAGGARTFLLSLQLAPSAGNRYQGLHADDHLTWTVTS